MMITPEVLERSVAFNRWFTVSFQSARLVCDLPIYGLKLVACCKVHAEMVLIQTTEIRLHLRRAMLN